MGSSNLEKPVHLVTGAKYNNYHVRIRKFSRQIIGLPRATGKFAVAATPPAVHGLDNPHHRSVRQVAFRLRSKLLVGIGWKVAIPNASYRCSHVLPGHVNASVS